MPCEICDGSSEAESEPVSCSCSSDAFKLSLIWKAVGLQALEESVDKTLINAKEVCLIIVWIDTFLSLAQYDSFQYLRDSTTKPYFNDYASNIKGWVSFPSFVITPKMDNVLQHSRCVTNAYLVYFDIIIIIKKKRHFIKNTTKIMKWIRFKS